MSIKKVIVAISLFLTCSISIADDEFDWVGGAKASLCTRLPTGTCDLIKWENHKNMINAITALRLQSVCESTNIDFIKKQIAKGSAHKECKALYDELLEAGLIPLK